MRKLWLASAVILAHPAFGQSPTVYEQAAATIQSGQFVDAVRILEPRLQQAPRDLKALTLMGMAVSAAGRPEEGNRYYRQALEVNPSFAPALKNLAANEMALGHAADARTHFERLLGLTPADPAAHLGFAQSCMETGETAKAVEALERMPAESPAAAHFAAGELLAKLERYSCRSAPVRIGSERLPRPLRCGFQPDARVCKVGAACQGRARR